MMLFKISCFLDASISKIHNGLVHCNLHCCFEKISSMVGSVENTKHFIENRKERKKKKEILFQRL
jgi:hypothetical protein